MSGKNIQHMPPEGGNFCDGCKQLVRFKVRTTKPSKAQPGKRVAYLYCPFCGHKATQVRFDRGVKKSQRKPRKRGE